MSLIKRASLLILQKYVTYKFVRKLSIYKVAAKKKRLSAAASIHLIIIIASCAEGRHNMPRPCRLTFDLLTLKMVTESHVTLRSNVRIVACLWTTLNWVFLGFSIFQAGYSFLLVFYSTCLFEIFDFKKCHDLENRIRDPSRSLEMLQFDKLLIDLL